MQRRSSPTRRRRRATAATLLLLVLVAVSGCSAGDRVDDLRVFVPNSPGGGYDRTARSAIAALESEGLLQGEVEITHLLGAAGSVATSRLIDAAREEDLIMVVGLGVVGALRSNGNPARLHDTTPIARLVEDQVAVLVPADSELHTLDDLIAAWRDDPAAVSIGGGSAVGGPDHLLPMLLADEIGIPVDEVDYVEHDGGGPLTSALLDGSIQVGFSGIGEFEGQLAAGDLRALAVSGEQRLRGADVEDVPTLRESGIDLIFVNWRGIVAPPQITAEARDRLIAMVEDLVASEAWQQTLTDNDWTSALLAGDDFGDFLEAEDERVAATLADLDLAE